MNDNDKKLLTEILKMKLSVEALNSMKLNASTNINESLHRSASASLPKNVNFGRNMEGRFALCDTPLQQPSWNIHQEKV